MHVDKAILNFLKNQQSACQIISIILNGSKIICRNSHIFILQIADSQLSSCRLHEEHHATEFRDKHAQYQDNPAETQTSSRHPLGMNPSWAMLKALESLEIIWGAIF